LGRLRRRPRSRIRGRWRSRLSPFGGLRGGGHSAITRQNVQQGGGFVRSSSGSRPRSSRRCRTNRTRAGRRPRGTSRSPHRPRHRSSAGQAWQIGIVGNAAHISLSSRPLKLSFNRRGWCCSGRTRQPGQAYTARKWGIGRGGHRRLRPCAANINRNSHQQGETQNRKKNRQTHQDTPKAVRLSR
jgi:hypothetical protein